jgi:hypothetical protein
VRYQPLKGHYFQILVGGVIKATTIGKLRASKALFVPPSLASKPFHATTSGRIEVDDPAAVLPVMNEVAPFKPTLDVSEGLVESIIVEIEQPAQQFSLHAGLLENHLKN